MDFAGRGLAREKTRGAARACLFPCHPPRYEFPKEFGWVQCSMAGSAGCCFRFRACPVIRGSVGGPWCGVRSALGAIAVRGEGRCAMGPRLRGLRVPRDHVHFSLRRRRGSVNILSHICQGVLVWLPFKPRVLGIRQHLLKASPCSCIALYPIPGRTHIVAGQSPASGRSCHQESCRRLAFVALSPA